MRSWSKSGPPRLWVAGLALAPLLGWAQPGAVDPAASWRQANALVAQFPRGHADLLKWEQAQSPHAGAEPAATATPAHALDLHSAEAVVELVWHTHPDVAATLNRLSNAERARVLSGRWAELDPALSWRLEGLDEVIDLAIAARKAWLQATTSQLALGPTKTALDAAQVAHTLGQRMVAVGNWSALALAPHQLAWANAQLNWQRARYTAAQDEARLLKLLQRAGPAHTLRWAKALPDVPAQTMDEATFERQLQRIQPHVNTLRRDRHRGAAQLAYQAYAGSHAVVGLTQNLLLLRQQGVETTQLHYNGMLKSTWDLLTEVQNQAQAQVDALHAQRDFALADIDLQWALLGGEPEGLASLGGAAADTTAPAH